ncbi:MAG: sugar kinase [Pseudomonadota bacterium]
MDILALGEPLVEFNNTGGSTFEYGFGGDVSNTIIAAARMGAQVGIWTRLGADRFGDDLRAMWDAEGVDHSSATAAPGEDTGVYFVVHGPDGHEFLYRRAGSASARMGPGDLPAIPLNDAQILHVSGISQAISASAEALVDAAAQAMKARGGWVSYDPNHRPKLWSLDHARQAVARLAGMSDFLLPGLDDAQVLTGLDDAQDIVRHYRDNGARVVALTMGPDGVLLGEGASITHIPAVPVTAIDATGAGDCFDGVFLARIAAGDTAVDAATLAARVASLSTQKFGAVPSYPTKAQVLGAA